MSFAPIMWRDFLASSWGRAPAKIDRALDHRIDPSDVFEALLEARRTSSGTFFFNRELRSEEPGSVQYTRQGDRRAPDEHLPDSSDRSLRGYAERMHREVDARFCVRLASSEPHPPRLDALVRLLFEDFDRELGQVLRKNVVVFAGDYDFTPAGVHIDAEPIIQAVIEGRKRAHFWEPTTWQPERDPHEPHRYLSDATTFELVAGDMVYWPRGQYHIFESCELSVAISCGFPDAFDQPGRTPS